MPSNMNFNKEQCWSCEFFSGEREYKKGWLGDSVETSQWGACTNQKSRLHKNTRVLHSERCSCYQKWTVLQSAIAVQKQKDAQAQAEREQRLFFTLQEQENQRQLNELRAERLRLEEERKKLEYERWYNSLTFEERRKEDARLEAERIRAEELRKQREEAASREEEQRRIREAVRIKKKKRTRKICGIIALIVIVSIVVVSVGFNIFKKVSFNNSDTGKFLSYLNENSSFNNKRLYTTVDMDDGSTFYFILEYKKNGWTDNKLRTCDFRATCGLNPTTDDHFERLEGFFFFNLQGSDNANSFNDEFNPAFCARTSYNSKSVVSEFNSLRFNSSKKIPEYGAIGYEYDKGFKSFEYESEWTSRSWYACMLAYSATDGLFKEAVGSGFVN